MTLLLFIFGLALLIVGAELLVKGASRLASSIGISPLIIGLTVVAFGTSSPELAVSVKAALSGQDNIVMGNVIGSNIFNVLFILGLSALITPLIVSQQLIRLDVPLMVAVSVLVLLLSLDGSLGWIDGSVLCVGLASYLVFLIYISKKESAAVVKEYSAEFSVQGDSKNKWLLNVVLVVVGLALLVMGSKWLVDSATEIARYFGVSDLIIGLTIIAAGTSMPEVVTSVVASLRGERDIAVGNIVGSNLFNILGVLGISSLIAPAGVEVSKSIISFDLPIMIAVAFACLPLFFTGGKVSRPEGLLLLGYYIAYTVYLLLATTHHAALPIFSAAMLYFVVPLTVITLSIVTIFALRNRH